MSTGRDRRRWLAHLDSEHRQQAVRARALRVDPDLLRVAHTIWIGDEGQHARCGNLSDPALRAVNDAVESGAPQRALAAALRAVPKDRNEVRTSSAWVFRKGPPKPWVSNFIADLADAVRPQHRWSQEPVLSAWDAQFDWADECIAYIEGGLAGVASEAVCHRVPFTVGQHVHDSFGAFDAFADLVRACSGDKERVIAHTPLLAARNHLPVTVDMGDLVAWTEDAGLDRAMRYARLNFTRAEGLGCTADQNALDVLAALRGVIVE